MSNQMTHDGYFIIDTNHGSCCVPGPELPAALRIINLKGELSPCYYKTGERYVTATPSFVYWTKEHYDATDASYKRYFSHMNFDEEPVVFQTVEGTNRTERVQ